MANSLLRSIAHNSFADGIFTEITNRTTRYYHYFGKPASWLVDTVPYQVVDSANYERTVRNEIVAMREISPSDVAYVIPRIDWTSGTVYDKYDDCYSTEIRGINLNSGGSNYTSPTVTIGTVCPTTTSVALNAQYYYATGGVGYLYTVTTAGTTGASNAVLGTTIGTIYQHGSAYLTCVGYQATATAALGTGVNSTKIVSVTMTHYGSGYSSATLPSITFSGGAGAGAAGTAVMVTGKTISNPLITSYKLEDTNYYVFNSANNSVYICVDNNNGAASTVLPTGTSSSVYTTADGYQWKYMFTLESTIKFLTSSYIPVYTAYKNRYTPLGSITGVTVDSSGSGYSVSSTITVNGDGTGAVLVPQVTDGKITGVTISNPGSGYTYANLVLSNDGTGGAVSPWLFSGAIPNSNQFLAESQVVNGALVNVVPVSGGYAYTSATVTISGDGIGATATAMVSAGKVTKITMTNRGSGYNWATVTITGDGFGATARAIIAPYGGLGKDSINQFAAKSLMFYTRLDNITNQGVLVTNDYRQTGIIKDPLTFSDKLTLKSNFATTCWKITASSSITGFVEDDIITASANSTTYTYRVIYLNGATALLTPIDNGTPTVGMQFTKPGTSSVFTAQSVIAPSVDKYSGDLMVIDNETAFLGTSAVLRTVVNF